MQPYERVGRARFIRIMLETRRPVFWLDKGDPDVGYIPFGSLPSEKVNLFICLRLRLSRQTYHLEDVVLVEYSEKGGRELAIQQQINPYSIWTDPDAEDRLRLGDYLGLAYTQIGRQFEISHLPWYDMQKTFARRRHEVRQAVVALVHRVEIAGLFYTDNYQLEHIKSQLSSPRYEGPPRPQRVSEVREWLIDFITWAITTEKALW